MQLSPPLTLIHSLSPLSGFTFIKYNLSIMFWGLFSDFSDTTYGLTKS